jgi:hypothetical protein
MDDNLLGYMLNDISFLKSCSCDEVNNIFMLPGEILQAILLLLDVKSVIRICLTNKDTTKYLPREYSDRSKYLYDNYFWSRFVSVNYDPVYYGVDSWSKENLEILLDVTVGNVWFYFVKLIIYGKDVPIYFSDQLAHVKIHYEDTIVDIFERYIKTILPLNDNICRSSALSIFTKNTTKECFNIVFFPHLKYFHFYNINLHNGLINREAIKVFKPDCKFNLFTSNSCRKLFYDKLLIQGPQFTNDLNQSIRQPLIPPLLGFKLHFRGSDCFGEIFYRYK